MDALPVLYLSRFWFACGWSPFFSDWLGLASPAALHAWVRVGIFFFSLLFLTAPRVLAMMSMECIVDEWLMHDDALEMTCSYFAFVMYVRLSWRDWLWEVNFFFTKDLSARCPEGMQLFST